MAYPSPYGLNKNNEQCNLNFYIPQIKQMNKKYLNSQKNLDEQKL